jgi:hypothetical protein
VEVYKAEYCKYDVPAHLRDDDLCNQADELGSVSRATMLEIQLCRSLLKEDVALRKLGCAKYLLAYGSVRRDRLCVQIRAAAEKYSSE